MSAKLANTASSVEVINLISDCEEEVTIKQELDTECHVKHSSMHYTHWLHRNYNSKKQRFHIDQQGAAVLQFEQEQTQSMLGNAKSRNEWHGNIVLDWKTNQKFPISFKIIGNKSLNLSKLPKNFYRHSTKCLPFKGFSQQKIETLSEGTKDKTYTVLLSGACAVEGHRCYNHFVANLKHTRNASIFANLGDEVEYQIIVFPCYPTPEIALNHGILMPAISAGWGAIPQAEDGVFAFLTHYAHSEANIAPQSSIIHSPQRSLSKSPSISLSKSPSKSTLKMLVIIHGLNQQ